MSKLGGRSYPGDLNPEEAVRWMKILVDDFGGKTDQKEAFAHAAGHKSTDSGSFRRKLADARRYQLMTPRGEYAVTQLGERLARPRDAEDRCDAVVQMLRNVDLIRDIDRLLQGGEPPEEFWQLLTEITDTTPEGAKDVADWIKDLYETLVAAREVLQGERSIDETDIPSPSEDQTEFALDADEAAQGIEEVGLIVKAGGDELHLEKLTDKNIEVAKQFLDSKKNGENGYQSRL